MLIFQRTIKCILRSSRDIKRTSKWICCRLRWLEKNQQLLIGLNHTSPNVKLLIGLKEINKKNYRT